MSKLSNTVKQLISLRGAALAPSSSSEEVRLASLLDQLHGSSSISSSKSTLLTLATGTFFSLNSPSALQTVWRWSDGSVKDAAILREAGLKSVSFIGLAKVINNLAVLNQAFVESGVQRDLPEKSRRDTWSESINPTFSRGRQLWNSIYTPHSDKLLAKLASYHPDLPIHILESHYSLLLSDPSPIGPLGRTLTSVLAIACLQAQTGVGSQATSHVFGLKKAIEEQDDGVEEMMDKEERQWLCGDQGAEWVLQSIEALRDLVTTPSSLNTPSPKAKL